MKLKIFAIALFLVLGIFATFASFNAQSQYAATAPFATPSRTPTKPPPPPSCPRGATARCSDGSCSFSQTRQGTCSHHGGAAEWY